MRRRVTLGLLALLLTGAARAEEAASQAPPAPPATQAPAAPAWSSLFFDSTPRPGLTLAQALQEALDHSPALRQYRSRVREAGYRIDEAESGGLPQLGLQAGYTRIEPTLDFQSPAGPMPIVVNDNWQVGLQIRQALLTFGRLKWAAEAATLAKEAAREEYRQQAEDLMARVSQTFLEYAWRQDEVRVAKERLEARQAHLRDVEKMYQAGAVANYDKLATTAAVAEAEQRLLAAQHRVDLARTRLQVLLGRPVDEPLDISLAGVSEPPLEDRADGVERAFARRPELAALGKAVEAARARVSLAESQDAPSVGLETGYVRRTGTAFQTDWQFTAGVGLSVPLFDGGATVARAAQAREAALQLEEMLAGARQQVTLDVEEAWLDLDEARRQVAVAQAHLDGATEAERVARLRYRVGVSTNLELLEAQSSLAAARSGWSEAGFRLRSAWVRWLRATSGDFAVAVPAKE